MEVDAALRRNRPVPGSASAEAERGHDLALDYLPGSTMFDPAAGDSADSELASLAIWFDAFVTNVDRTPRNQIC